MILAFQLSVGLGANTIWVAPQCLMMNSQTHAVALELRLMADTLAPCPFTIITFIGHIKHHWLFMEAITTSWNPPAPLLLKCAVTNTTNYDILVGEKTLNPLGFGLDNWTEEACVRPGWSAGVGRRELIPMAFAVAATIAP